MKKILLALLIAFFIPLSHFQVEVISASSAKTYFAKISNPSTYIYSLPIKSEDYKIFEIPTSYFVLLTGDENQSFFKAKYSDIEGYVPKEAVTVINENPNYPYAQSSFRVFSQTYLYSYPSKDAEAIIALPSLTSIMSFYGQATGEELIPSSTDVWYYCSYQVDGVKKNGYVFSYFCDQLQKIQPNTETVTNFDGDIKFTTDDEIMTAESGLSGTAQAIIIVACVLPCLVILLLLVKKKSNSQGKTKIVPRLKRRKDYYEFNEDDI